MDSLGSFLVDHVIKDPASTVTSTSMYKAYSEWARANGETPMTQHSLSRRLGDRGFESHRTSSHRGWKGVRLASASTVYGDPF